MSTMLSNVTTSRTLDRELAWSTLIVRSHAADNMQKLGLSGDQHITTIKAPTQNWLSLTAIIIMLLGFGFNAYRDISNSKDDEAKLEARVNTIQATLDSTKDQNSKQFSDLRVSIAELSAKVDMLLQRNQLASGSTNMRSSSHLESSQTNGSME